jgi:hypothetical protein
LHEAPDSVSPTVSTNRRSRSTPAQRWRFDAPIAEDAPCPSGGAPVDSRACGSTATLTDDDDSGRSCERQFALFCTFTIAARCRAPLAGRTCQAAALLQESLLCRHGQCQGQAARWAPRQDAFYSRRARTTVDRGSVSSAEPRADGVRNTCQAPAPERALLQQEQVAHARPCTFSSLGPPQRLRSYPSNLVTRRRAGQVAH